MTTVIVVAIVALVFFVTISIVAFMTWKREEEMRTDSLKGIQSSLEEAVYELSEGSSRKSPRDDSYSRNDSYDESSYEPQPTYLYSGSKIKKATNSRKTRRKKDPFSWMRTEESDDVAMLKPDKNHLRKLRWEEITEEDISPQQEEDIKVQQIELPEIPEEDEMPYKEQQLENFAFDWNSEPRKSAYNVGKSGRKYTAEELEMLIKE